MCFDANLDGRECGEISKTECRTWPGFAKRGVFGDQHLKSASGTSCQPWNRGKANEFVQFVGSQELVAAVTGWLGQLETRDPGLVKAELDPVIPRCRTRQPH